MNEDKVFGEDSWAVVEVLGHNTFAGKISEYVVGGTAFIRVDVPELPEQLPSSLYGYREPSLPAFTKLIGADSIYAITPCTQAMAFEVAKRQRSRPITVVDLGEPKAPRPALQGRHERDDDDCDYGVSPF